MDLRLFQSLSDQPCGNYRCNGDNEIEATDAAYSPSTGDQNIMFTFISNARDTIVHSLNRDTCSVKAELASAVYPVEGDDNDTDTEGR